MDVPYNPEASVTDGGEEEIMETEDSVTGQTVLLPYSKVGEGYMISEFFTFRFLCNTVCRN